MTLVERSLWTSEQFAADLAESKALFRRQRLEESPEEYSESFESVRDSVESLIEETVDLTLLEEKAFELLKIPSMREAIRYLAGPPISADDLDTLIETKAITSKYIESNPEIARTLVQIVKDTIDRGRFPWLSMQREPTVSERHAAVIASAALIASQRFATSRRTKAKKDQEQLVRKTFLDYGLEEINIQGSISPSQLKPGQFCSREPKLGKRKADLIVGLWDSRVMPIECKVSNSAINSVKRLNNDAAAKAESWIVDFGRRTIVPVAVISGVFKRENLEDAQERGLTIYWSHKLEALTQWMDQVRAAL